MFRLWEDEEFKQIYIKKSLNEEDIIKLENCSKKQEREVMKEQMRKSFLESNARQSDEEVQEKQKLKIMREVKDMKLIYTNANGIISKKTELLYIMKERIPI